MEIEVGYQVVTNRGQRGIVDFICNCEECKRRGFDEPQVLFENGSRWYITDYDAKHGFMEYYRIGDQIWPDHVNGTELKDYIKAKRYEADEAVQVVQDAEALLTTLSIETLMK